MRRVPIDDPADRRIVAYTDLTDERLRRTREAPGGDLAGVFMCEGRKVTERALAAGHRPLSVFVASDLEHDLPALPADMPVFVGSPEVVASVTGYRFHRGFVAAFERPPPTSLTALLGKARRLLVCENVTNATNLGVIIRSAAALGMDALLVDPTSCDPLYRRVVRVSMGGVFAFPHARLPELPRGLDTLVERGFLLIGLSPDRTAKPLSAVEPAERTALVLGAEGPGLTDATTAALDDVARIPMRPGVDSLNVAAAAAIASYVLGGLDR